MGIGTGIFLFVVGAILAFALNFETEFINLDLVGYLLMGAGVVVFIISLIFTLRRNSTTTETRTGYGANGEQVTRRDTRDNSTPPL